jgi:DNA polymerase I-like protein with 3'-5' exonuclease and polymerase domains
MARLLGASDARLYLLAIEVSKSTTPIKIIMDKYGAKSTLDLPTEVLAQHCAEDSRCTLALYNRYVTQIDSEYFKPEMEVISILLEMGLRGVAFSEADRVAMETELESDLEYYGRLIREQGVDNPGSPQQVGFILAKRGNFLPMSRKQKQLKTDEDTLEFIDDPLAALVLSYRYNSKILSTYIRPLEGQDRAYTEYGLDTAVGRTTSSKINMQNVPGAATIRQRVKYYNVRNMFMPDSGVFTTMDYERLHMYILMHLSGDRQMKRILVDREYGGDIHQFFADKIPAPRKLGKTINLAIPYGATAKTISMKTKISDIRRCSALLDFWFRTFPDAAEWLKAAQREGIRDGWALPTLFGRRIKLPEDEREDELKNKAVNYPVLGTDGEIIKRALIVCKKHNMPLAITVHDSISCDGEVEFPREELENIAPVRTPIEVKRTFRWE